LSAEQIDTLDQKSLLATASSDYPVTPGDIYGLSYLKIMVPDSIKCFVDNDYTINLGVIGKFSLRGMLFNEAKALVEKRVEDAYLGSKPSFSIKSTGLFLVKIDGEVPVSQNVQAWGLTRLSEIVNASKTSYASIRDVSVVDFQGNERHYDLFKASRYGDFSQDPYVRPGDNIHLKKYSRIVTINGEIRRPGKYELLDTESLKDLIEVYGGGFTENANTERISVVSDFDRPSHIGALKELDYASASEFQLSNNSTTTVPSIQDILPCVYFEGAVVSSKEVSTLQVSQRITYSFIPKETLGHAVLNIKNRFSTVSDLKNAYILRDDSKINIDISAFLYSNDYSKDLPLEKNDVVVVPFRQFFVTVSGAVLSPSRYPYVPERDWSYYIGLAGGFNIDLNANQSIIITDVHGSKKSKYAPIEPEDTITADTNGFWYYFGKFATVMSVLASTYTVYSYLKSIVTQ
jgi:Periplasmic protein involved in polysaccharide export